MTDSNLEITSDQIIAFLSKIDLFSNLSKGAVRDISEAFELVYLSGNSQLIKQGDASDCLYVLMFGFLRTLKEDAYGKVSVIGELSAGNVVGEIGCLFDEPRTASVYTIRDSVLLKMTRAAFDALLEKHPNIMMGIVRQSVQRMANPEKYSPKREVSCFCVMPAGNDIDIKAFVETFAEKLLKHGSVLVLTDEILKTVYGYCSDSFPLENAGIFSLFQELESKYRFLIYVASQKNAWAKRCIHQADKILLVGQYGKNPALGEVEQLLFTHNNDISPTVELVLLFNILPEHPPEIRDWFQDRQLSTHYKVRSVYPKDFERLVRLITGNALGLVLSGGGSYALSHVGTIRALEELNVPVDYIAGTSMGSLVGGLCAQEFDSQVITKMLTEELTKFEKRLDYTLPIVALIKANFLDKLLYSALGKTARIENLWQKYFCVSTNISANALHVHQDGLLWKAIRSSISLPGILPAVLDKNKDIFVDGAILNNLPVDCMLPRINGGKILASSVKNHEEAPPTLSYKEYTSSGWHLLFKYIVLPKFRKKAAAQKQNFLTIASIVQGAMIIGSNNHQKSMEKLADYSLVMDLSQFNMISFESIQEIIDSGYDQAMKTLETMDLSAYQ